MNKKKSILLIVCIGTVLFTLGMIAINKKEVRRFEEDFALQLPVSTKVIFSKSSYDWHGEGYTLYMYSLSNDKMEALAAQAGNVGWQKLPLSASASAQLIEGRKRHFHFDQTNEQKMPLYPFQNGYYKMNSISHVTPQRKWEVKSYQIGVIDLETNVMYYFYWTTS